ncbi:MAG TPA: alkaline phosphatase PhoX, partial [Actinomycetales bacterium]|nr:alkaline phosphatase PhoX [Actinomycetales bacterium]
DFPDNVTTSPRGTLVICEDGDDGNFLRGLTTDGHLFDIAENRIGDGGDEFAGSTFSPDGETLYVNIQSDEGMSIAIWGDWRSIGV